MYVYTTLHCAQWGGGGGGEREKREQEGKKQKITRDYRTCREMPQDDRIVRLSILVEAERSMYTRGEKFWSSPVLGGSLS